MFQKLKTQDVNESSVFREVWGESMKGEKNLFRIGQAANACGTSRSTLLRMEEKGLLKPAYIEADSGRRYYDNHNVARILQIEKFKLMGLNPAQIESYFSNGGDVTELLSLLKERFGELQRGVEELSLRAGGGSDISVQMMTLPAVKFCMRECMGHTITEKYNAMYDFYGECITKGHILSSEAMFAIEDRHDYLDGYIGDEPYPIFVCVPVKMTQVPEELVTLPECRVLSVLYYGDYGGVDEAWLTLGREVKARGLKPAGFPRVLGIVAPYTGREIESRRYCSRLVLPVEE